MLKQTVDTERAEIATITIITMHASFILCQSLVFMASTTIPIRAGTAKLATVPPRSANMPMTKAKHCFVAYPFRIETPLPCRWKTSIVGGRHLVFSSNTLRDALYFFSDWLSTVSFIKRGLLIDDSYFSILELKKY